MGTTRSHTSVKEEETSPSSIRKVASQDEKEVAEIMANAIATRSLGRYEPREPEPQAETMREQQEDRTAESETPSKKRRKLQIKQEEHATTSTSENQNDSNQVQALQQQVEKLTSLLTVKDEEILRLQEELVRTSKSLLNRLKVEEQQQVEKLQHPQMEEWKRDVEQLNKMLLLKDQQVRQHQREIESLKKDRAGATGGSLGNEKEQLLLIRDLQRQLQDEQGHGDKLKAIITVKDEEILHCQRELLSARKEAASSSSSKKPKQATEQEGTNEQARQPSPTLNAARSVIASEVSCNGTRTAAATKTTSPVLSSSALEMLLPLHLRRGSMGVMSTEALFAKVQRLEKALLHVTQEVQAQQSFTMTQWKNLSLQVEELQRKEN